MGAALLAFSGLSLMHTLIHLDRLFEDKPFCCVLWG
nr:MAG TPA: hypothetical protein [Caudoviricetes sp.]